jgi:hypothetical protein
MCTRRATGHIAITGDLTNIAALVEVARRAVHGQLRQSRRARRRRRPRPFRALLTREGGASSAGAVPGPHRASIQVLGICPPRRGASAGIRRRCGTLQPMIYLR